MLSAGTTIREIKPAVYMINFPIQGYGGKQWRRLELPLHLHLQRRAESRPIPGGYVRDRRAPDRAACAVFHVLRCSRHLAITIGQIRGSPKVRLVDSVSCLPAHKCDCPNEPSYGKSRTGKECCGGTYEFP